MSSKPLSLPLARAAAAAAAASFAAVVFARSFFFSLQKPLCPGQAAIWHAVLQYATHAQPAHFLNVTPFLGLTPHAPHKTISSGWGCCDEDDEDMANDFLYFAFLFLCLLALCFDTYGTTQFVREELNSNSADSSRLFFFCRLFSLSLIHLSAFLPQHALLTADRSRHALLIADRSRELCGKSFYFFGS